MSSFSKMANFHEFGVHVKRLDDVVDAILSRLELAYDEHPLHYNRQVEFRSAKYIDNRQAFSFWPSEKPFGEYPLTKPFFDKAIEKLNEINKPYHIVVDFVTDYEEQYSSFYGPPKSYAIEVAVFFGDKQLPTMRLDLTSSDLELCKTDHDFLDKNLAPIFETLSVQAFDWYVSLNVWKKLKA